MRVIKRYPNRKLYDTDAKRYISLDEIAEFIRAGDEIYVVDYASGEDLTTLTLTQIIFEQEKKGGGFLPQAVLTGLIQAGGSTLSALRRTLASSADLLYQVDEEIERRLQVLINRGELAEDEAHSIAEKLIARHHPGRGAAEPAENDLQRALARRGVPTRDDFRKLSEQLDAVAASLDSIRDAEAGPAQPPEPPGPAQQSP